MTAPTGASAQVVSLSNHTDVIPASATILNAFPIASQSPAWVSVNGAYGSANNSIEVGLYNHYTQSLTGIVTILALYTI